MLIFCRPGTDRRSSPVAESPLPDRESEKLPLTRMSGAFVTKPAIQDQGRTSPRDRKRNLDHPTEGRLGLCQAYNYVFAPSQCRICQERLPRRDAKFLL